MNNDLVKARFNRFVDELPLKLNLVADKMNIPRSTVYKWLAGDIELAEERLTAVSNYIAKYGF